MVRIFKNIGIGYLLMAIRRCSSLPRCCRCSMSDVYIGRTLILMEWMSKGLNYVSIVCLIDVCCCLHFSCQQQPLKVERNAVWTGMKLGVMLPQEQ